MCVHEHAVRLLKQSCRLHMYLYVFTRKLYSCKVLCSGRNFKRSCRSLKLSSPPSGICRILNPILNPRNLFKTLQRFKVSIIDLYGFFFSRVCGRTFRAELMSDFRRLNAAYVSPPPPLASTPRHRGDTNGNIATINGGLGAMSRSLSSPVSSPHDVKMTLKYVLLSLRPALSVDMRAICMDLICAFLYSDLLTLVVLCPPKSPKPKSGHGSLHHPRSADQASASQQGAAKQNTAPSNPSP
mgnify:CR=1 FL=1|jgi:hypothetical protein